MDWILLQKASPLAVLFNTLDLILRRYLIATLVSVGNAKGGVNPAVSVHHILGHVGVDNAVNGVTWAFISEEKAGKCANQKM